MHKGCAEVAGQPVGCGQSLLSGLIFTVRYQRAARTNSFLPQPVWIRRGD